MGNRNLNQVLQYTRCINIWLESRGENDIILRYNAYVKYMAINKFDDIKTLSAWLSEKNQTLFGEYSEYITTMV